MLKYLIKTNKTPSLDDDAANNDNNDIVVHVVRNAEKDRRGKRSAEVKRKYESEKRCRKFSANWKKSFPWVKLSEDKSKMFCDICMLYPTLCDKDSKFVKGGCGNLHIKSLQTHDKSAAHQKCVRHNKAKNSTPGSTPAETMIQKMNEKEFEKMRVLFRIAHSLAKKGHPFEDFPWSLDLHEAAHNISLGHTYRNSKQCHNFISFIAEAERVKLATDLARVPFYSVMTDGTTDSSISEAEIMYAR